MQKIVETFRSRGHSVWFDQDKIHPGDNWREEIAKGILSSNGVIAFLSRSAVRNPGVCLNELSIAVGIRGGNIKTVLLEPEQNVEPPASISHIQWLDMSQWRDEEAKGEEHFQKWFDEKMSKLITVVESQENRSFSGQISAIRMALPLINYDVSKQRDLMQQVFVGRKWLTNKIEDWLDDPLGSPLCILYGDPGIGKSAFAANYCHFNGRVAASIFCEYNRMNFNKAQSVIQTLAYLLASRLPEYRVILADILNKTPDMGKYDASDLFNLLLTTPLTQCSIDGGHETVCIVIDGLDECGDFETNPLAEVLSQYVPRFPQWVRVLLTARKVESVKHALADIPYIDLCANTDGNMDDIKAFFSRKLAGYIQEHHCPDHFVDLLAEKSGGIFLYARIVSQAFLDGKMTLENLDDLPRGISSAFYKWFGWFFGDIDIYREKYRLPLGVLASSPEPIPLQEYTRLFGWDDNEVNDFIRRVGILMRRDTNLFGKTTMEFSHKYLKDWLDGESSGVYRCTRTATLRCMGNAFHHFFKHSTLTEYETLYLFSFLKELDETTLLTALTATPALYLQINNVGDICMENGHIEKAWQYYTAAEQVALHCLRFSNAPDVRLMHSISELKQAEIYEAQGNLKKAFELYEHCYHVRLRLNMERGNLNDRKCLGLSCERLAQAYIAEGNNTKAKELLLQGLEIRIQLDHDRGDAEDKRNLGSNYMRLAELYEEEGDTEAAGKLFRNCVQIRREQVSTRRSTIDLKDLVVALIRMSSYALRTGDLESAEQLLEETASFISPLASDMKNAEIARAVSFCYLYYGELLRFKGDLKGAEKKLQECLTLRKKLVADRGTKEDLWNLGGIYFQLAALRIANREYDAATELVLRILAIDEDLVRERGKAEDHKGIVYCLLTLGKITYINGNYTESISHLCQALPIAQRLYDERGSFDDREDLAFVLNRLSQARLATGDFAEAEMLCDKALELRKYQVDHRGLCDDRKFYGGSCLVKAQFHLKREEYDTAEELLLLVLDMDRSLVRQRGSASDRDCLCMAHISLAEFYLLRKNYSEGLRHANQAVTEAEALCRLRNSGSDVQYCSRAYELRSVLENLQDGGAQ